MCFFELYITIERKRVAIFLPRILRIQKTNFPGKPNESGGRIVWPLL